MYVIAEYKKKVTLRYQGLLHLSVETIYPPQSRITSHTKLDHSKIVQVFENKVKPSADSASEKF